MKKNKQTTDKRKANIKRAKKRSTRLKKTQGELHLRKAAALEEKKAKDNKLREAMDRLMQSRFAR